MEGLRRARTQRRRQILDTAAQVSAETGSHGTSLADVASGVGVPQPGLVLDRSTAAAGAAERGAAGQVGAGG